LLANASIVWQNSQKSECRAIPVCGAKPSTRTKRRRVLEWMRWPLGYFSWLARRIGLTGCAVRAQSCLLDQLNAMFLRTSNCKSRALDGIYPPSPALFAPMGSGFAFNSIRITQLLFCPRPLLRLNFTDTTERELHSR
jgi:hypothetical protein